MAKSNDLSGRIFSTFCPILVFVVIASSDIAAQESLDAQAIRVVNSPNIVTVQVNRTVPLRKVLEVLCERTRLQCDVAAASDQLSVVPLTLHGTLSQIFAQLIEGSGLNYAFQPLLGSGRLLLSARTESAGNANPAPLSATQGPPSASTSTTYSNPPDKTSANTIAESTNQPEQPDMSSSTVTPSGATSAPAYQTGLGLFLPYSQASSISSTAPDSQQLGTSPYSDSDGKPLRFQVTNEPPPFLPYAYNGKPIPTPPINNHQKMDYPIPATIK